MSKTPSIYVYDEESSNAYRKSQNRQTSVSGSISLNRIAPDGRFIKQSHYDLVQSIVHRWNNETYEPRRDRKAGEFSHTLGLVENARMVLCVIQPDEEIVTQSDKIIVLDTLAMWRDALWYEIGREQLAQAAKVGKLARWWRRVRGE